MCKRISALSNTIHRNKLKRIKDLNVRLTTTKLLEENIEHFDIIHSNIFFSPPPRVTDSVFVMDIWDDYKSGGPQTSF